MKYLKYLIIIVLIMPIIASAKDVTKENMETKYDEFGNKIVGEAIKYYKTVTVTNNSAITSVISPEVTSFTTEITKEEYDNAKVDEVNQPNGYTIVESDYKLLKTTMSESGNYYRYHVRLTWKNIPKVRSNDIIAIGHYSSVKPAGPIMFNQSFCEGDGYCYEGAGDTDIVGDNGTAAIFSLPSSSLTSLTQTLYFDVKKSSSTTVKHQTVAGDYAHAVKTISEANAKKVRVDIKGIIHDSSVESYYDTIGAAIVDWFGSW